MDNPTPNQAKAIRDSFSLEGNSETRIAGQLREEAGPYSDHILLLSEVRRPPGPYMHRKTPWRPKGSGAH